LNLEPLTFDLEPFRMRRFFISPEDIRDDTVLITGAEARHLARVLRLRPGDQVCLLDNSGARHTARLQRVADDRVEAVIIATSGREEEGESWPLHLGLGLLKGSKMDLVMQKATELGVAGLHPFVSRHCVVEKTSPGRRQRWERIVREACKQCGRPAVPPCAEPVPFDLLLAEAKSFDLKLICWENEGAAALAEKVRGAGGAGSVLILVGPEGGFAAGEIDLAREAGFSPVTLGRRILRAETACLAAVAIVQFLLGNLEK